MANSLSLYILFTSCALTIPMGCTSFMGAADGRANVTIDHGQVDTTVPALPPTPQQPKGAREGGERTISLAGDAERFDVMKSNNTKWVIQKRSGRIYSVRVYNKDSYVSMQADRNGDGFIDLIEKNYWDNGFSVSVRELDEDYDGVFETIYETRVAADGNKRIRTKIHSSFRSDGTQVIEKVYENEDNGIDF